MTRKSLKSQANPFIFIKVKNFTNKNDDQRDLIITEIYVKPDRTASYIFNNLNLCTVLFNKLIYRNNTFLYRDYYEMISKAEHRV